MLEKQKVIHRLTMLPFFIIFLRCKDSKIKQYGMLYFCVFQFQNTIFLKNKGFRMLYFTIGS